MRSAASAARRRHWWVEWDWFAGLVFGIAYQDDCLVVCFGPGQVVIERVR